MALNKFTDNEAIEECIALRDRIIQENSDKGLPLKEIYREADALAVVINLATEYVKQGNKNDPLTVDELKALRLGDYVYAIDLGFGEGCYKQINDICEEWVWFIEDCIACHFADYGTKWLAYKNKEQYEQSRKS